MHDAFEMTVSRRLERLVIDAVDDGRVDVLAAGRGDDHLRAPPFRCADAFSLVVKSPVHSSTTSTPSEPHGSSRRIALREHADAVAVDDHRVAFDADRARKLAVRGVVARQVRVGLRAAEIVDRDDRDVVLLAVLVMRAQHVAPDAAVAVDGNLDRHGLLFVIAVLPELRTLGIQ